MFTSIVKAYQLAEQFGIACSILLLFL